METYEARPVYGQYAQQMLSKAGVSMRAAEPAALKALQARLDDLLVGVRPVHMLDAGCGKYRVIPVADDLHIVGVDISAEELSSNDEVDEAIIGDIQTCDLGESRFDVVICWNVLEHVEDPLKALLNFKKALKSQGVLVVAVPHAMSLKGLVTRFTPHWFHDKCRSWIRHRPTSELAFKAFPTVMSPSITPKNLCNFARENGFTVELSSEYENWEQKKLRAKLGLTGRAFQATQKLVSGFSLGAVTAGVTDAIVVMQKHA